MLSEKELDQARSEAKLILSLEAEQLSEFFFEKSMRRNLSRIVRHLDKLVRDGGDDSSLAEKALTRLGFDTIR